MRPLPAKWMEFIAARQNNYALMGFLTLFFPDRFIRSIYANNTGKEWGNGRACMTLSFDCDYPEDVEMLPLLLDMLKKRPYHASFACVGYWIEKYPDIHRRILDEGHEIINHTYTHPDNDVLNPGRKFRNCSLEEKADEIEKCHVVCQRLLDYSPVGLRIPHFKHNFNPDIYKILSRFGYVFSSSTWLTNSATFGLPFMAEEGIIEFPLSTCPGHPFTVFDTWHSLNSTRWVHYLNHRGEEGYMLALERLLDIGTNTNSYLNIYLDPLDIPRIGNFRNVLDRLENGDMDVVTYGEFMERYPSIIQRRNRI